MSSLRVEPFLLSVTFEGEAWVFSSWGLGEREGVLVARVSSLEISINNIVGFSYE